MIEAFFIFNIFVLGMTIGYHLGKNHNNTREPKPNKKHKVTYREMKCGFMDINAN